MSSIRILGNKRVIGPGDVQWMTAGSSIIHQEMPLESNGRMGGFQSWVNLPSGHKMMESRYREVRNERIPEIMIDPGFSFLQNSGYRHTLYART